MRIVVQYALCHATNLNEILLYHQKKNENRPCDTLHSDVNHVIVESRKRDGKKYLTRGYPARPDPNGASFT